MCALEKNSGMDVWPPEKIEKIVGVSCIFQKLHKMHQIPGQAVMLASGSMKSTG